jgi:hypothetical protein
MTSPTAITNVSSVVTTPTTTAPGAALGDIKSDGLPGGKAQPVIGGTASKVGLPGNGDGVLLASGIVPYRSPTQLVNTWNKAITPYVPATGRVTQPLPSALGSVIKAPTFGGAKNSPTSQVFSPGSQMIKTQGVPQLTGKPSETTLTVFNSAMTPDRLNKFAALNPSQKMLARTMLAAAVDGLNQGQLAPKDFNEVVGRVLLTSQKATFADPKPTTIANVGKQKIPGQIETVPTPAKRPGAITSSEVVPTPSPRPGSTTTAAKAATAAYPSTGPNDKTPSWWAQATNDPKDPNMGTKLVKLITDAREFARQAQTINVNQVVDPSKSTKTPMQEWNDWRAA